MRRSDNTSFISYDLSPEELIAAQLFSDLQLAFLKTQLCQIAEEKLNQEFIHDDIESFTQQAYLKGQMDMLRYLINCHENTVSSQLGKEI